jgi:hypothetical protein
VEKTIEVLGRMGKLGQGRKFSCGHIHISFPLVRLQMLFSYVEGLSDNTIGFIMPFYNQIKIVSLLALSIPRSSVSPSASLEIFHC